MISLWWRFSLSHGHVYDTWPKTQSTNHIAGKLSLVEANSDVFPENVLTMDEVCFHNFEPETINTMEALLLIRSKEAEANFFCRDCGNLNVNTKCIVSVNYLQRINTINSEPYANFQRKWTKYYQEQTPRKTEEWGLVSSEHCTWTRHWFQWLLCATVAMNFLIILYIFIISLSFFSIRNKHYG